MSAFALELMALAQDMMPSAKRAAADSDEASAALRRLNMSRGELVESLFVLIDWVLDAAYVLEMATATTLPLTDSAKWECITSRSPTNATCADGSALGSVAQAQAFCSTPEKWSAPWWVVALLCAATLAGMIGDLARTRNLHQTREAEHQAATALQVSVQTAAAGRLNELQQAKESVSIFVTVLEDGVSVSCVVILQTIYISGPWDTLAQFNVGASLVSLAFKLAHAFHNKEVARNALRGQGGMAAAAGTGNLKDVLWLLTEEKIGPNDPVTIGVHRVTPLIAATVRGHDAVALALLEAGADVEATADNNGTPIIGTGKGGSLATARALIAAGADVNAEQTNGLTALLNAARFGFPDICSALAEAGADLEAANNDGQTAMQLAANDDVRAALRAAAATRGVTLLE